MNDTVLIGKNVVEEVKKMGIDVVDAYLYGSHAKGNADQYSDIDVCIISPRLGKDFTDEMVMLKQISRKIDDRVEIVPMGLAGFADPFDPFVLEVKKTGIKLV